MRRSSYFRGYCCSWFVELLSNIYLLMVQTMDGMETSSRSQYKAAVSSLPNGPGDGVFLHIIFSERRTLHSQLESNDTTFGGISSVVFEKIEFELSDHPGRSVSIIRDL